MVGKKAETILNEAVQYAFEQRHEYFTLEHVLLCLLSDSYVVQAIQACGGDLQRLREETELFLKKEVPSAPPEFEHPVATLSVQRLVQRALFQVQSAGKEEIQPIDLLVALFQAQDSQALFLLKGQGIQRLDLLSFISHGGAGSEGESEMDAPSPSETKSAPEDYLKTFSQNLNQLAEQGGLDPLIGRDVEMDRVIQTLCRRRKNNPLLVGEAGVGKTAIAEGLAQRIMQGKVPDLLKGAVMYSLEMGSLIAGTKYRGDFEQRLKRLLAELTKLKERGETPILLVDEIHTLMGAGAVGGGTLDAASILKPALSRGEVRLIGTTTFSEYRATIEKDRAFARRFQRIEVEEPNEEDSVKILNGLKSKIEEHHQIRFTSASLIAAVSLAKRYLTDRFLPDKALDVLDEAGAKARLMGQTTGQTVGTEIGVSEIEAVVAQIARVPIRALNSSEKENLRHLERNLRLAVFGQNQGIEALVTAIRLARSGLRGVEKPVGSFLFCGPTGVGKTELSKQLGSALGVTFIRFDMSEYSEKHTVSRLIGAPPGYVGFEQQGLLSDAVLKNPHCVILLDEIEKAHPDVWNILLQIMDHGMLTDNNGRKADFRNVILILTSNVGSREMDRNPLGLGASEALQAVMPVVQTSAQKAAKKAVEDTFSPEFRNRFDSIVYFNPLIPEAIALVVDKQLCELETQLLARNVESVFSPALRAWLAHKGYDRKLGARPLARLIGERIKKALANEILFGRLEQGGFVRVGLRGDEPEFEFQSRVSSDISSDFRAAEVAESEILV
ncbi:AAA family ATPase [Bdellovibrionota bacterium FG-2]